MKIVSRWGLLVACCLFVATGASAQDVLKRIAQRQQINVGYSENSPPFSFLYDGQAMGYSVDLCLRIVDHIKQVVGQPGLRINLQPVTQDQVPRVVGGGTVDLMCAGVSDTPQRRAVMNFSPPIFVSSVRLLVRADEGHRSVADLKGGRVVVLGRTTAEKVVQDLSDDRALALKLTRLPSTDAALSQLRLKQADAWARDEILLQGSLAREPDRHRYKTLPEALSTEVIAVAMPPDAAFQRTVQEAMSRAVKSGQMEALYQRWFVEPNPANPTGFNMPLSADLKAAFDRLR